MPCAPATCEAFVAPTPADARPASPWLPCGEGCRELAHDWAPDNHRILSAFGSSDGRQRFVAYMRDLDDSVYVGQGPWEVQVVDLADNRVVYDAISTLGGGACRLDLHAAGGGHALMALLEVVGVAEARRWVWTIPVSGRAPSLAFSGIDARGVSRAAISSELWAVGYSWLTELEWRPLGSAGPMGLVWSTTAGRSALSGVAAYGGALFFETSPGTLWSWTDKQGAGVLLDLGHDGVACGVVTDGAELLWREGRGLDPASGAFQEVALMVAPLTTEASQLTPVRLRRSAPGGGCLLTAGGGHVVGVEGRDAVVTRVDDGFFWRVPPRVGFEWGRPLYVDAVELALVELPTDETALAYGVYGEAWTIVRRTIASLGKPQPPEP